MKRYILLGISQLILSYHVFSQGAYNTFVKDGASWVIGESYCDAFFGCDPAYPPYYFYYNTYYYKLQGDTVINAVPYEKLFLSKYSSCPSCPIYYPGHNAGYSAYELVGFLREDTSARKVYFKGISPPDCWNHYDSLFMDFSLSVGDSFSLIYRLNGNYPECDTSLFTVDSIAYTVFQNDTIKTWYIGNNDLRLNWGMPMEDFKLYEGVGYSFGFNLMYDAGDGIWYARGLRKYCEAGDTSCKSPLKVYNGISDIEAENVAVAVYPNPATEKIIVKAQDAQINTVLIVDMNGRIVVSSTSAEINIEYLEASMYFLQIQTSKGLVRRRVIKL